MWRHFQTTHPQQAVQTATAADLLDLLSARRTSNTIKVWQAYALEEVVQRYATPALLGHPLQEGAVLALVGTMSFGVGDLRRRLAQKGITFSKVPGPTTTHLLVGPKLKDLAVLSGKTLLLERDVQAFLDQIEQPYLQQPQGEAQVNHLRQLLRSEQTEHHWLAVELFKGGGFIEALLLDAIRVLNRATDPALKKDLETYIRRYAAPESLRRTLDVERPLIDWSDDQLLTVLQAWRNAENKPRQAHALRELVLRYASTDLSQRPLEAGALLCLQGIHSFKVTNLRQRLAALDIQLTKDLDQATHVLIGPKLTAIAPLKDKTLLIEQDLQRFLDQVEQPYLQQEKSVDQVQNLRQLLLSNNLADQWVVATLFEGGGFVDNLLLETIMVAKMTPDKKLRQKLAIYIKRYAEPSLYQLYTMRHHWNIQSERKLTKLIRKSTKHLKTAKKRVDLGLQIARILYDYKGTGLQYLWYRLRQPQEVINLLQEHVQNLRLDLSNRDISFLPKAIGQLSTLQELNLSNNPELSALPETFKELKALHTLYLCGTSVYQLDVLQQLPKLHTLVLGHAYLYAEQLILLSQLQELHLPNNICLMLSLDDRIDLTPQRLAHLLHQALPKLKIVWY